MSDFILTDITAVKFYKNFILAGVGSSIEIFNKDECKFIKRINVLKGQKIHGIQTLKYQNKLLIFGGKQFSILEIVLDHDGNIVSFESTSPTVGDDWILSADSLSEDKFAILTAHNVVQIWDIINNSLDKKYISRDNSILYSGNLFCFNNEILVFSGTVFSEVIISLCGDNKPLHHLKGHKGVIFSITYRPMSNIIVTTSDDRSVRIWKIHSTDDLTYKKDFRSYWENAKITCEHILFGHTARVMGSHITSDFIISIGEDSRICFWSYGGKLLRTILAHQNACIWSLDAVYTDLVTGGGDCGLILHPIIDNYDDQNLIPITISKPKKLVFTARQNFIIMNESNYLIYCDSMTYDNVVHNLRHTTTYKLLSLSSCKQIIAVVDMNGKLDIFIENCKGDAVISKIIDTELNLGKILSLHWAGNRNLVLCSDDGKISLLAYNGSDIETVEEFTLPSCKERWLTSCALSLDKDVLVVSDRCGHIHVYFKGNKNPVKIFNRVYEGYGANSIVIKDNGFTTTGRDGTIKYFSLGCNISNRIKYMTCKYLDFQWLEKFLDKNEKYICGFHERNFVVYDVNKNVKILEVSCGGGHRSWDAIHYIKKIDGIIDEFIKVLYVRNNTLLSLTFQLSKIISKNIRNGTHSKEINCLKTQMFSGNKTFTIFISGGEDTTLRVSISNMFEFQDVAIFKHISSIRSLRIFPLNDDKILLASAGGRAQICAKIITFKNDNTLRVFTEEIVDYLIKGTDKDRKGDKNWKSCKIDFDPETRIMDLETIKKDNNNFKMITACSDAALRIFELNIENGEIKPVQELRHHKTCILKTHVFQFKNKTILVSCTTRGEVALWEISETLDEPILELSTNKSGINAIDVNVIDETKFMLATAGDDNAIHLNLIEVKGEILNTMKVIKSWSSDKYHSSQITGVKFVGDLILSTSIDQRVSMFKLSADNDSIECEMHSQHFSDVSDIHGMDVVDVSVDSVKVCVFGKGLEVLQIPKPVK